MVKEEEWVEGDVEEDLEGERGGMVKRRDGWSGESGGVVQEEEWLKWGNVEAGLEWRNGVGQRGINFNSYDDKVIYPLTCPV